MLPGYHRAHSARVRVARFTRARFDNTAAVEQINDPPETPKDATQATEGQREEQDKLDRQGEDPEGPAHDQTYRDIPDEN